VYEVWLKKLEDLQPALYTGTESPLQKEESKRRFVSGETKVLIMSLRSGAGLDGLQHVCRTGVFGELDYSKGVHGQCGGRLHRDGQRYPVFLYYLNSGDGSDPPMMDLLGIKSGQLEGTINPDADFVSSLEVDEGRVRAMAERYLKSRSVE
jgi:SNF2 family DNA or RNA helicase